jgi:transaldolase
LIASGTKLWLDSVDPEAVKQNRTWGATGATSNPIIIADVIKSGHFDNALRDLLARGLSDYDIAWSLTDSLVRGAQEIFLPAWRETRGDDGYVSFELDPLLEDPDKKVPERERTRQYVELGKKWSAGHQNRLIKVPATSAGLAALEELAAAGVAINVTLVFSERQYVLARDAIWRGAQQRASLDSFKSVYSIFVSRLDVYTEKHVPELSPRAQGQVGIVNAKHIWKLNSAYWKNKPVRLAQEMVFASTGTKKPEDPAWKYVEAFAGSDIETNPPATNAAVQASGRTITRRIDQLPDAQVLEEIKQKVSIAKLEETLMREGVKKFADPMKALLALVEEKRHATADER